MPCPCHPNPHQPLLHSSRISGHPNPINTDVETQRSINLGWAVTQAGALGWDQLRSQGIYGDGSSGWEWEFWLGMGHVGIHPGPALHIQLFANESVPDHVGYAKVKITLINENDNRPIFSQPLYNVSLYENVTVGTSVLTVLVSPHNTARPLSSGADHREATRRILPWKYSQMGTGASHL